MSPQTTSAELPVGHLGFGAMRITGRGIWGHPTDENEAIALLRRVVDKGVTFLRGSLPGHAPSPKSLLGPQPLY
jgi:pyridoxine 4-dehydrogenase